MTRQPPEKKKEKLKKKINKMLKNAEVILAAGTCLPEHLRKKPKRPLAERLRLKILTDTHITCDINTYVRTHAGYWQRRNGAYAWTMNEEKVPHITISSSWCASELVKRKYKLEAVIRNTNDIEIFPEEIKKEKKS